MGSSGWRSCHYCKFWVHNAYLHDPYGLAYCDWCCEYLHVDRGKPEEAGHWWCTKQYHLRRTQYLANFRVLPPGLRMGHVPYLIASFYESQESHRSRTGLALLEGTGVAE